MVISLIKLRYGGARQILMPRVRLRNVLLSRFSHQACGYSVADGMRFRWSIGVLCVTACCLAADVSAQTPLTWAEVRARFEANNPTLRAGQLGIDESKADEVTAYLRPNPGLSIPGVLVNVTGVPPDTSRFQNLTTSVSLDYLFERAH